MMERGFARFTTLALTFLLMTACGGDSSSKDATTYARNYVGTYTTGAEAMGLVSLVSFSLSWNEEDTLAKGVYKDDYFAPDGLAFVGTIYGGEGRRFVMSLPEPVGGVHTLTFTVKSTPQGLSAAVEGATANGHMMFTAPSAALDEVSSSDGKVGKPANVGGLFARIAGVYDWTASRTGERDATWTVGRNYRVTISRDGKLTIPTDGATMNVTYGQAGDTFEVDEQFAYVVLPRDACKLTLQFRHESDEPVTMTCALGDPMTGPRWTFKKGGSAPATRGTMGALGVGDAVGRFTAVIEKLEGDGPVHHQVGSEVAFTISEEGDLSWGGTTFSYSGDTFQLTTSMVDGVEENHLYWYHPKKNASGLKRTVRLVLRDGTFSKIEYVTEEAGRTRLHHASLRN